MRIVTRDVFMTMPKGTVFMEYEPTHFGNFKIKHETITGFKGENIDWFENEIGPFFGNSSCEFFEAMDKVVDGGNVIFEFDSVSRDGCFEYAQLYAVLDKEEVLAVIDLLQEAVCGECK